MTVMITPAVRAALMSRSAASRVTSIGFSTTRCLPAAAARMPTSACMPLGTQTDTTSISSRASSASRSGSAAHSRLAASAFARSGWMSVTATSAALGSDAIASACIEEITPVPTMPKPCDLRAALPLTPIVSVMLDLHVGQPGVQHRQVLWERYLRLLNLGMPSLLPLHGDPAAVTAAGEKFKHLLHRHLSLTEQHKLPAVRSRDVPPRVFYLCKERAPTKI